MTFEFQRILIFLIVICAFTIGGWYCGREWGNSALLSAQGKRTEGEIVSFRTSSSGRAIIHLVKYRFHLQEATHHQKSYDREAEQQISWRHRNRLNHNDRVEVIYLPRNPKLSKLTGTHTDNSARDNFTIITIMGMIVISVTGFPFNLIGWVAGFLWSRFGQ
jgi:hypothetical protein